MRRLVIQELAIGGCRMTVGAPFAQSIYTRRADNTPVAAMVRNGAQDNNKSVGFYATNSTESSGRSC